MPELGHPSEPVQVVNPGGNLIRLHEDEASFGEAGFKRKKGAYDEPGLSDMEKALGLSAVPCSLRQSSIGDWLECHRKFAYKHRFRIQPAQWTRKKPLDVGTFFHALMEDYHSGQPEEYTIRRIGVFIDDQVKGAQERQALQGITADKDAVRLQADLERWLALARCMFREFVFAHPKDDKFEMLKAETVVVADQQGFTAKLEGTIDNILVNKETKEAWLVDYKTVGRKAINRVRKIPIELQPRHYRLLGTGLLKQMGRTDLTLVGILHCIIQRPGIEFGRDDRNFTVTKRLLKRGPRKGEEVEEKEYDGPPLWENYLARTTSWYRATGDYAHLGDKWMIEPPILESWYRFSGPLISREDHTIYQEASKASRARPDSARFYRNWGACDGYGDSMCEYIDLCRTDMTGWRALAKERFVQVSIGET